MSIREREFYINIAVVHGLFGRFLEVEFLCAEPVSLSKVSKNVKSFCLSPSLYVWKFK